MASSGVEGVVGPVYGPREEMRSPLAWLPADTVHAVLGFCEISTQNAVAQTCSELNRDVVVMRYLDILHDIVGFASDLAPHFEEGKALAALCAKFSAVHEDIELCNQGAKGYAGVDEADSRPFSSSREFSLEHLANVYERLLGCIKASTGDAKMIAKPASLQCFLEVIRTKEVAKRALDESDVHTVIECVSVLVRHGKVRSAVELLNSIERSISGIEFPEARYLYIKLFHSYIETKQLSKADSILCTLAEYEPELEKHLAKFLLDAALDARSIKLAARAIKKINVPNMHYDFKLGGKLCDLLEEHIRKGNLEGSEELLRSIPLDRYNKGFSYALRNLGLSYLKVGNIEKAKEMREVLGSDVTMNLTSHFRANCAILTHRIARWQERGARRVEE